MAICALCRANEADKKNTHYLTDAIIRTCLNVDGSNAREKGLYFSLDNTNPFVEFNFQRIDELTLEKTIGRKPTEEEIANAKLIPFSVDYVFCRQCEDLFTGIETKFLDKFLALFRKSDLSGQEQLVLDDYIAWRNFFYIQIYRSAICEDILALSPALMEQLRIAILEKSGDITIPLAVTYLETTGGDEKYTENYIGFTSDRNPYLIFMNDFVIQVYDAPEAINFSAFYGLNNLSDFKDYINYKTEHFTVRVFSDAKRKKLLFDVITNEKVKKTKQYYMDMFDQFWRRIFGTNAPLFQKERYIHTLINGDHSNLLKYTRDEVYAFSVKYMARLFNVKE